MSDDDSDDFPTATIHRLGSKIAAAVDSREFEGAPRSTGGAGRKVDATTERDAADRAYGPFITWEDIRDIRKAVETQTEALEAHSLKLRANTSSTDQNTKAVDQARDTNTELIASLDRLADLLSQKPA